LDNRSFQIVGAGNHGGGPGDEQTILPRFNPAELLPDDLPQASLQPVPPRGFSDMATDGKSESTRGRTLRRLCVNEQT